MSLAVQSHWRSDLAWQLRGANNRLQSKCMRNRNASNFLTDLGHRLAWDEASTRRSCSALITAADFAVFPDSLPSGDVSYELLAGYLGILPPADVWHGTCATMIGYELCFQGEKQGIRKGATEDRGDLATRSRHSLRAGCALPDESFAPRGNFAGRRSGNESRSGRRSPQFSGQLLHRKFRSRRTR